MASGRPFYVVLQAARDCREVGRDWAKEQRGELYPSADAMANAPAWPVGTMLAEAARRALPPITDGLWDADELEMLAIEVDRAAAERWDELRGEADRHRRDALP